ncbi:MAG: HAD-IIIA family hydrolase [Chloroflexota bacterium]
MTNKHPAIFLDRDGVIIENRANYVRSWDDVEIYPQALQALTAVAHSPYKIIIVTNQSAVGRGIISLETAHTINEQLLQIIRMGNGRVDGVFMCPHAPEAQCHCRKPQPGLLLQAAAQHNIDLSESYMIGDALSDLQAGLAAGVPNVILLRTGRGQKQAQLPAAANFHPITLCDTLGDALSHIIF